MGRFGRFLLFMGLGSFLLHLVNMEFILVSWVDNWGTGTGNMIRVLMILAGGAMWYFGSREEAG